MDPCNHPTNALLFRYSALTFNGHRIHYDLPYARDVEGYPGLVVQGPLTATLLVHEAERHILGRHVSSIHYSGIQPIFAEAELMLAGSRTEEHEAILWAENGAGARCAEVLIGPA